MTDQKPEPVFGYRPPDVTVRAAYSVGEVTDEITVEITNWNGDLSQVTGVIDALTDRKPGAEIQATTPAVQGDNVRVLRGSQQTSTTGEEVQA